MDDGPVVVLLDSVEALEWAAAEAGARGVELRILHTFRWNYLAEELPVHETADAVLAEAREHVLGLFPSLRVETIAFPGRRLTGLLAEARRTANPLLVLPHNHRLQQSLTRRLHRTPVTTATVTLSSTTSAGQVVVVLDGTPPDAVLGVAFRAARRRGTGVSVVGRSIQVQAWRTAYPEVPVRRVKSVDGAALVVTGGQTDVPMAGPVVTVHGTGPSRLALWSSGGGGRRLRY